MTATRYPPATWKGDGESSGSYLGGVPWRVVLHTTETEGIPGYDNGGSAPHLTYNPRHRSWIQHTDLGVAARALKNLSGGVETNRARALQVEIVCYSDRNVADNDPADRIWVGELPDHAYEDLRAFLEWTFAEYGVEDNYPGVVALNYGQANAPGFRLSAAEWEGFGGVCGHQHVTENDHWDPGAIEWSRLIGVEDMPSADEVAAAVWAAAPGGDAYGNAWQTMIRIKSNTDTLRTGQSEGLKALEELTDDELDVLASDVHAEQTARR